MNLVRVGKIVVNFDLVIDVLPGEAGGPDSEGLIVNLVDGRKHTFTGDDADALRDFLTRMAKGARGPRTDRGIE